MLTDIHGLAAGAGFCYWATDPMDNPDYEQFCRVFHETTGKFPQTTTAAAAQGPCASEEALEGIVRERLHVNRFSVLTRKMLDRIHAEYTPEELAYTQLVFQMPDGKLSKSRAGRGPMP